MKLLSIVIPSYNVEKYIDETITSLVKCKELQYLDIIVVNDGSTDNTEKIVMKLADNFSDVITVINKSNGGHGSTINTGLKYAKGKYFVVVDGDDWVDSYELDKFINFIIDRDEDIIISGHYKNYINEKKEAAFEYVDTVGYKYDMKYLLTRNYLVPLTDICYKTQLLKNCELNLLENTFYVDEEYCSIPFTMAESVCFSGCSFYHYRIGDVNQSISVQNIIKRVDHQLRVFNRVCKLTNLIDKGKDNYTYITRRKIAMANNIMLTYFIFFPDKKKGRSAGNKFVSLIKENEPVVADAIRKKHKIFKIMNYLHFTDKQWQNYQKRK